jgi:uncharacterized membrane protein
MMDWLISGMAIGLAVVFTLAGALKVRDLTAFERVVVDLLPVRAWRLASSRTVAGVVVGAEILTGFALVAPRHEVLLAGAASAAVLSVCFLAAMLLAARRRMPCNCFGPGERAAGRPEMFRAAFLVGISLALLIAAVGRGFGEAVTAVGPGATAVACAVLLIALLPRAFSLRRETLIETYRPREELSYVDEALISRRSFVARSLAAGLAAAAAVAIGSTNGASAEPPPPPRSCLGQFDLCYGCTTRIGGEQDVACCSECYAKCQGGLGPPCGPGLHCAGCWPGP